MRTFISCTLLATALSFGFSANASDLQNIKDYPEWFQSAMASEAKLKETSNIEIEALGVKGELVGKYTLAEQDDSFWYYTVDIGSNTPIECYAFLNYDGPANSLHNIMAIAIENTAKVSKMKLNSTVNYAVNSGVIADTPFISADTLYTISNDKTSLSGVVKGKSAETNQSLQVCLHNEIGYRDTFNRVFTSFVEVFVKSEPDPEFFEVVYQTSVNGINMGFVEETYTLDADGDVAITNKSVMLMPLAANSFMRIDRAADSWSLRNGSLINANEYTVQNGTLASQFSIDYNDEEWQVSGEIKGKEVSKTLEHDGWLLSGYGSYLVLENLRNSQETSGTYSMWSSSVDPNAVIEVKLSQLVDNPNANFEVDMGPSVMQFMADEKGIFQHSIISQGPMKLSMKLIHSRGEPIIVSNPE